MRLAALVSQNNGTTVDVSRLLHERVSVLRTDGAKNECRCPFSTEIAIPFRANGCRRKNADTIRKRKNALGLVRKRSKATAKRPSPRKIGGIEEI